MAKGENHVKSAIIIGGGLVGSLCGSFLSKRGYKVDIYEFRDDIRTTKNLKGRSINLSLSSRGIKSLKAVGLEEVILKNAVPMKGRLLHGLKGETKSLAYDPVFKQCINSVSRTVFNQELLTAAECSRKVKLHFGHKLIGINSEEGSVNILNTKTGESFTTTADLIVGADGAFSTLRRSLQQTPLFEFSQNYIIHGYLELTIPAERGDRMASNHLHIWPRNEFMMIALPNQDNSWTLTLFMPFHNFDLLDTSDKVLNFFKRYFMDSIDLIGPEALVADFMKHKPSPLVSIKCNPYHFADKFLLIGDAAHAMVPFYGQGMNAGFEDCFILNDILEECNDDVGVSIRKFSEERKEDVHTICDLAMYNYEEMRSLVTKKSYYLRKLLDEKLYNLMPDLWIPLYNSVSFSQIRYKKCLENRKWQDQVIQNFLLAFVIVLVGVAMFLILSSL